MFLLYTILVLLLIFRKLFIFTYKKPKIHSTMIILGSGGHTSEMFRFLKTLSPDLNLFEPRNYIIAKTDIGENSSEVKAIDFEMGILKEEEKNQLGTKKKY